MTHGGHDGGLPDTGHWRRPKRESERVLAAVKYFRRMLARTPNETDALIGNIICELMLRLCACGLIGI